ncbi:histidine phosphatase family protein [Microbacterium sp. MPKO10]|uniref:histidine phosphatase family protein n=1 Tax=Microbacterium sp. MPKO10 TaxID=2989818 RepID=UPI0022362C28|nr:histidine phosphatase family protein [Microbacterium sp. MPKO10]MCW4459441.1 phosphoglycerate mutase family protein [Microbacterium sp. MPKO10]
MTRRILLLRHAMPDASPDSSPDTWPLSDEGATAASQLCGRLPANGVLASSPELKARQTLEQAVGRHTNIVVDSRFAEVNRPGEPFDDGFHDRRFAWIVGHPHPIHEHWETPKAAASRFQAGIDAIDGESIVVASHGMVLTAWLVAVGVVRPGQEAGRFWSTLSMPDLIEVPVP